MLATISVIRLINRIDTLPVVINAVVVVIALGLGTLLAVLTIIRITDKKNK